MDRNGNGNNNNDIKNNNTDVSPIDLVKNVITITKPTMATTTEVIMMRVIITIIKVVVMIKIIIMVIILIIIRRMKIVGSCLALMSVRLDTPVTPKLLPCL